MKKHHTYPFGTLETTIAYRYLRAKKKEGAISVIAALSFLGIMMGVATLIIVMAVMNGFRDELLQKILNVNGHITLRADVPIKDYQTLAQKIHRIEGVEKVIPYVQQQAMIISKNHTSGAIIRGVSAPNLEKSTAIANQNLVGNLDTIKDKNTIAVGKRIALNHALTIGDSLTIISPEGPETPFGVLPRMRSFTVGALFEIGMSDYDNALIYMDIEQASDYFLSDTGATAIEIFVSEPEQNNRFIPAITAETQTQQTPLYIETWQQQNQLFFDALKVERNVMFLILTMIILVAALNIISSLIMMVQDKKREIAILRTIGLKKYAILRIFLITGGTVGILGTAIGCLIGILISTHVEEIRAFLSAISGTELFSPEIYYLSKLPAKIKWDETITVIITALGLSFSATLYPAWKAAQTEPARVLRDE